MRKWPFFVVLACVAIGLVWFWNHTPNKPSPANSAPGDQPVAQSQTGPLKIPAQPAASNAVQTVGEATSTSVPAAAPVTPPPPPRPVTPYSFGSADAPPDMEPATVLSNMRIVIRQYGSRFGGNPVGTNEEITKALNGENPKQVRFITEESGLRINGRGELVDYWGTPFFFHQLSGTEMEIHSAGPDRIMWTADDLVTK
jgi:hypothetical protein